jgi:hypothetical protein
MHTYVGVHAHTCVYMYMYTHGVCRFQMFIGQLRTVWALTNAPFLSFGKVGRAPVCHPSVHLLRQQQHDLHHSVLRRLRHVSSWHTCSIVWNVIAWCAHAHPAGVLVSDIVSLQGSSSSLSPIWQLPDPLLTEDGGDRDPISTRSEARLV